MKRRDFIRMSSIATAAAGVGLVACSNKNKFVLNEVPENSRLRLGIIGVGSRGSGILKVLKQVPEFKVVAVCDTFDFRLEAAKKNIPNDFQTFKKYEALLSMKGLDAVIIATPLYEHYRMVMTALDCDVHILCEKALAYTIEQSMAIKKKANLSNKIFQISYQYQLNPMFQTIKDLIANGYMGKITRVEATWDRNNSWRRPLPDKTVVQGFSKEELDRRINWRMYKEYSGGLNAELGSHQYNMIDNLLGAHPTRVMGTGGIDYWKDGRETFDNVHMLFDYPNGVKAGFHSGTTNKYEGYQLKLYGKKATIVSKNMSEAFIYPEGESLEKSWKDGVDSVSGATIKLIDDDKKHQMKPMNSQGIIYPTDNFSHNASWMLYKNFAAAINEEEELLLGLKDGYQSAISVHMANQAVRNSEIVEWRAEYDI